MKRISCIICAYNESDRIEEILNAITDHPLIEEIIVVNDGSTDDTLSYVSHYSGLKLISYSENKGKTYALSRGIGAAKGELLLLLDADLAGITPDDISALAAPVLDGRARVSISMRSNSLWIYRMLGLDFVSGERVLPRSLIADEVPLMEILPRWGGEAFINQLIIKNKLPLMVVHWPGVINIRKSQKVGAWRGFIEETKMIGSALSQLGVLGTISQNLGLLLLQVHEPSRLFLFPRTILQRSRIR